MVRYDDDWVILVDDLNYMPCRDLHRMTSVKQKDGTEKEVPEYGRPLGYYTEFDAALRGIMKKNFNDAVKDREVSLAEALRIIQEERRKAEAVLKQFRMEI